MARKDRAATPAAKPAEVPYVVLLGGDVTTGDLSADNDSGLNFPVVVVQMVHAPYIDLGTQHSMNVAVLREDAIQLADAIKAAALSLPIGG